jgi:RNA-directed DNA polymerase
VTDIFFKRLCSRANLFAAWRHVRSRAQKSESRDIRNAAEDFDAHAFSNLQSIQSKLVAKTFAFPPAEGILKDKRKRESQGKRPRPIVLSDIRSRVVQRALLQCLQPDEDDNELSTRIGAIKQVNESQVNFGGTPSGGVPRAIHRAVSLMNSGHQIFYKSDIGSFFTQVPHGEVARVIFKEIQDEAFVEFFRNGLNVELKNTEQLGKYLDLFPDNEIGVPQGSSLSAFAGNVFLHEVDTMFREMEGVSLIRYVDDVVLLGDSNDAVQRIKAKFTKEPRHRWLSLYDPGSAPDKASEGHVRTGLEYLGCVIRPHHVEPSKKAKTSLLGKVDKKIQESKFNIEKLLANDKLARKNEPTFAQSLSEIDSTVRGWANSFRFVNNRLAFSQLDRQIHQRISDYRTWLSNLPMASESQRHRILGVFQTHDVEHKPLEAFLIKRAKRLPQPIVQSKRRTDLNRGAKVRNGRRAPSSG